MNYDTVDRWRIIANKQIAHDNVNDDDDNRRGEFLLAVCVCLFVLCFPLFCCFWRWDHDRAPRLHGVSTSNRPTAAYALRLTPFETQVFLAYLSSSVVGILTALTVPCDFTGTLTRGCRVVDQVNIIVINPVDLFQSFIYWIIIDNWEISRKIKISVYKKYNFYKQYC